jgi:hypothetical protein
VLGSERFGSVRFVRGSCEDGRVRARVRVQGGIRCVDVSALLLLRVLYRIDEAM